MNLNEGLRICFLLALLLSDVPLLLQLLLLLCDSVACGHGAAADDRSMHACLKCVIGLLPSCLP